MKQKHKNNILLAEFLDMLTTDSEGNIKEDVNSFKFHNDWNWAMLALQKCDAVAYELRVHDDWIERFQTSLSQYEILDVYDVCIEFVKWYNENKSK